jgi:hypothetical protein
MALLRGSFTDEEERDTDRKHPLTTPNARLFSEHYILPQEFSSGSANPKRKKFFFKKRGKSQSIFFFYIKRNLYSSCSRIYSSRVKS